MKRIMSKKTREVMSKNPVALRPNDDLFQVKKLFKKHDFNAFPVVDSKGKLIGLVSKTDFLKCFTSGIHVNISKIFDLWANDVESIMTKSPYSVRPDSKIIDAANIMVEYRYRSVPVVRKDGKLIGMITSTDISKYTLLELKKVKV